MYKKLCTAAVAAIENSYSPYSGCSVGAALLTKSGKMYTGCNIENAAFTPGICAERVALFKAVSSGEKDFEAIAVAGGKGGEITGGFSPCGVCRQALLEFCEPDFEILIVKGKGEYEKHTLGELLPFSFSSKDITND